MVKDGATTRGARLGDYELLARIAAGGMGEVFIARRRGPAGIEQRVALKTVLPHLADDPRWRDRFLEEMRFAAMLSHPHIVPVSELGWEDGRLFMAMALVEGVSLARLLRACRREGHLLSMPLVRLLATGLCEALQYAHQLRSPSGEAMGLVHRDVNPANILVSAQGAVLLGDFGIARPATSDTTHGGRAWGKYPYMPPEQLDGVRPLDARVDVFAASVTLYEALTGVSPFLRETDEATIQAIRGTELPDVTLLRPDVSPRVAEMLRRGAARERGLRLGSASDLLDGVLEGPVARPSELGALVERLCAAELAVFRRSEPVGGDVPVTRTLRPVSAGGTGGVTARWLGGARWPGVLGGLAVLAGGGWLFLPRGEAPAPVPVSSPETRAVQEAPRLAEVSPARPEESAPPEVAPRVPVAVKAVEARAAVPAPKAVEAIGFLTVDARPWAVVSVNGREVDRTPLARYPLPAGRHLVVFHNPTLGLTEQRTVQVESGKVATVRVDFAAP
ncbi:serine/threonine protein kinase [Myxococcus stipitatus DSM 14675]|uniref:Serine/threonine protein kinase n=1 Tax=Myxococcus stipitatus (strain DSM 14675 / JCM 12634 / Mx s8) TaxID=1278073 RepID=L7U354_MYXSD|nr:serine/threonine-protein kinase [Myxococcus stipitatus]AGC43211.1 serine/threonine protein kinase [Myxococcus stipitatus DSM 14675]